MPSEQSAKWNGPAGCSWIDAQDVLDRLLRPFEDLLVDAVMARSARAVLDVGCGTGGITVALARELGAGVRSVGVDISEPMIAAARLRAEREGVPATFIAADAQTHGFEPASFDTIISRFGVMFFDDFTAAFTNLRRAAGNNAGLRFISWRSAEENPFMTTAERAAAPLLPNLPARVPDAPGQFGLANQARTLGILENSGWQILKSGRSMSSARCRRKSWSVTSRDWGPSAWHFNRPMRTRAPRSPPLSVPRSSPTCMERKFASARPAGWSAPVFESTAAEATVFIGAGMQFSVSVFTAPRVSCQYSSSGE
jgi:SAM-dependent methyltransferase